MPEAPGFPPYVLSTLVMPWHENHLDVMHGGWMVSWLDKAAWVAATRAVVPEQRVLFKAIDELVWEAPIHAGEVCTITAHVATVGTSSLRIPMTAVAEDPRTKTSRTVCRAVFTMVAVSDSGTAEPVRLHPPRPDEE